MYLDSRVDWLENRLIEIDRALCKRLTDLEESIMELEQEVKDLKCRIQSLTSVTTNDATPNRRNRSGDK